MGAEKWEENEKRNNFQRGTGALEYCFQCTQPNNISFSFLWHGLLKNTELKRKKKIFKD